MIKMGHMRGIMRNEVIESLNVVMKGFYYHILEVTSCDVMDGKKWGI